MLTPKEWTIGLVIKIPKTGDLSNCNNWRCIILLSLGSKIIIGFLTPLLRLLKTEQAGFRKGRSCSDYIFTQILEQSHFPTYTHFENFRKAFDSIHRDSLYKTSALAMENQRN